jgi:type 1 glutamine amidotransferase
MGAMHPITWYHGFDGGRAWYTAMGHTDESFAEPAFLQHLREGIKWAAGVSAP